MRTGRCTLLTTFAMMLLGASLLWPAASPGIVTLGSDFSHKTGVSGATNCGVCTVSQTSLPGRLTASPVNGTVVTWRVRSVGVSQRLRVLDPLGAASLFRSSSATEITPGGAPDISIFTTSLPISIGDRIGLDLDSGYLLFYYPVPGVAFDTFAPPPANGASASPASVPDFSGELMLNADVKPKAVFVIGRRFPLPEGLLKVRVNVSNPGTLTVSAKPPPKINRSGASAAGRTKGSLVKRAKKRVRAPGPVTLKLKPSKASRARLRRTGRATGVVRLSFRPTGGKASSQRFKARLKL